VSVENSVLSELLRVSRTQLRPSNTAKIIGGGYKQLYRGKLVGFVVGAYNNPFEALKKKRKRA